MGKTFSEYICEKCDQPTVFHNPIADELDEQITQLKTDLAEFGGHYWDCPAHPDEHGFLNNKKCTCGWAEMEKGL